MVSSCLFGLFVFGEGNTLTYRFVNNEFFNYLSKTIQDRRDPSEDDDMDPNEIGLSIDDKIALHFAPLLGLCTQTSARKCPIQRITLESNVQVFFDQLGDNKMICMVDGSFPTLIVLKTFHLFKSLVKFHIGAYAFKRCPIVNENIDRISASLQYYLNNVLTNQSLIFESSEYLNFNTLIRQQCIDACSAVVSSLQFSPSLILITCKDKIVHTSMSNEQNRVSNGDTLLLLLNNISRTARSQFESQEYGAFRTMAHVYKTRMDLNSELSSRNSTGHISTEKDLPLARRTISLPTFKLDDIQAQNKITIEKVFMKTSSKYLSAFTLYTIPITGDIFVLILIEWKSGTACANLTELIDQLSICINHFQLSFKKLNLFVRAVESNIITRRFFENKNLPVHTFLDTLNSIHDIYKSISKGSERVDTDHPKIDEILTKLESMYETAMEIFHQAFMSTDEQSRGLTASTNETNRLDSPMLQTIQNRVFRQLGDWLGFIEARSQGNITISFCQHDFPGLVHFALIDRSRGRICTPALFSEDYRNYLALRNNNIELDNVKEKKIINFELECLTALQRGCTSYTMTDEYFTYNYTLRLQESNGASMLLHRPFVKSEPPGVLHYDFYEKLVHENYSSYGDQTSIGCFELICIHLRFVPPSTVREHCEQLWPKLMELDD